MERLAADLGALLPGRVVDDYGAFLLRRGALLKGAVCLREAVAVDPAFVPALLALAAVQVRARGRRWGAERVGVGG